MPAWFARRPRRSETAPKRRKRPSAGSPIPSRPIRASRRRARKRRRSRHPPRRPCRLPFPPGPRRP
ncbi:MAG: hypothetical protein FJX54_10880 [Alphaproteobacteria bacterium]|nr:hypothetical protein [Alphaproteobacteria bacterium]